MIIRLADCPSKPWKNGMGRTREIAVHPPGADSDDFLWRVSIAEVDSGAPFSTFPGIDRSIMLLDGAGFTMRLDDGSVHAMLTPFEPFHFPGEAKVEVTLASGTTRDFNLMVRRARAHGEVMVWRNAGVWQDDPAIALVYCARGVVDTVDGRLHEGDAWRPATASRIGDPVTLQEGAVALATRIDARGIQLSEHHGVA